MKCRVQMGKIIELKNKMVGKVRVLLDTPETQVDTPETQVDTPETQIDTPETNGFVNLAFNENISALQLDGVGCLVKYREVDGICYVPDAIIVPVDNNDINKGFKLSKLPK